MIHRKTFWLLVPIFFLGCKTDSTQNQLAMDGGQATGPTATKEIHSVVELAAAKDGKIVDTCTGVIVSTNTVISSARCVTKAESIVISRGIYKGMYVATKVYAENFEFKEKRGGILGIFDSKEKHTLNLDFSALIFDTKSLKKSFKHYVSFTDGTLTKSDQVVLLGSTDQVYDKDKNTYVTKDAATYWGSTKIGTVSTGGVVDIPFNEKQGGIALTDHEHGGPLLKKCQLAGIGVRAYRKTNWKDGSYYVDLTQKPLKAFLKDQVAKNNGYVCGLNGQDQSYCGGESLKPADASSKDVIPCGYEATTPQGIKVFLSEQKNKPSLMAVSHEGFKAGFACRVSDKEKADAASCLADPNRIDFFETRKNVLMPEKPFTLENPKDKPQSFLVAVQRMEGTQLVMEQRIITIEVP